LREYAQGWMAHYGIGMKYNDVVEFDGWVRRRLRMCYWKQWRKPRKRIRELMKLGTKKMDAISLGISRKSYWRLSRTLGTHMGLTNQHFKDIGVPSLRDQWCRIHYPDTSR
jgi:RNA-directed DNA polymerase